MKSCSLPILLFVVLLQHAGYSQTSGAGKVDLSFNTQAQSHYGPGGPVNAIAPMTNGQVLVGGAFAFFNPAPAGPLVKLNADGSPDSSFSPRLRIGTFTAGVMVRSILPRSDGRFYIVGNFTTVNLLSGFTNLALIDGNGIVDTNFVPTGLGTDLSNARLAVTPDDKLLVAQHSNLVHRLDHSGRIEASFILSNTPSVASLASAPDGGIFVGSYQSFVPSVPAMVAKYDSNGLPVTSFTAPPFEASAGTPASGLAVPVVQADGKPIINGYFTLAGGVQRGGVGRLNTDGSLDPTFVPGPGGIGTIYGGSLIGLDGLVPLPDGRFIIYRSGPFRYASTYRNGIGRISATGVLDVGFDPGKGPAGPSFASSPAGWGITTVAVGPNGEVYVGGTFTNFNNTGRRYLVRLNAGPVSSAPTITGPPQSQSVTNGVDVTFSVAASGPGPFAYSWKHNGRTIAGANSATLVVTNVDLEDVGAYIVTVANSAGAATAAPAILTVNGVSVPDLSKPGFKVTSPASTFVVATQSDFMFQGTAKDNQGLALLSYRQDSNAPVQIQLASNWTFHVTLHPGTNIFLVTAADTSGNYAATQRVVAFYAVTQAIDLKITGAGSVSGATDGQGFAIGRSYPLKATPNPGNLFSNWIADGITLTNPALNYFLWSNATVCANFVTNPFIALQGNYTALFYDTNHPAHENSGRFTFKLTTAGAYSGKLTHAGVIYSGSGQFGLDLRSRRVFTRKAPLPPLTVDLELVADSDQVIGTVTDGVWMSEAFGHRATFSGAAPATNAAGKYTLLLSGHTDPDEGPLGQGFSTVSISTVGAVQFKGALAENSPLAIKATLASNGLCAVYVPLYKNSGSILGWLTFADTATNDIHGPLLWTKPSGIAGALYSGGFTGQVEALGSRFVAPASGTRVINLTNGELIAIGGNLPSASTNSVTLDTANKLVVTSTNLPKLALKLTTSSGLLGGTFTHPAALKSSAVKGVVLQKQNGGGGFLLGTNLTGSVYLGPPGGTPFFED
jgi:hypothetical protein